jgi:hypothetical protein
MLAKQVLLSHASSLFCSDDFGDGGLVNYLLGLASNYDPPESEVQILVMG